MKKITTLLIFLIFSFPAILLSQEKTKPLSDSEIIRNVSSSDVEGIKYQDVTVSMRSISPDYVFSDNSKVKVKIVKAGRVVWKKTLKNSNLYVFSDGQVQVGKPNFSKILIHKNSYGNYVGKIREYEGVY